MKLWLLEPKARRPIENDPWKPRHDKVFGFIVRAKTAQKARKLADGHGGDENLGSRHPWLDPKVSTCQQLKSEGQEDVILIDCLSG